MLLACQLGHWLGTYVCWKCDCAQNLLLWTSRLTIDILYCISCKYTFQLKSLVSEVYSIHFAWCSDHLIQLSSLKQFITFFITVGPFSILVLMLLTKFFSHSDSNLNCSRAYFILKIPLVFSDPTFCKIWHGYSHILSRAFFHHHTPPYNSSRSHEPSLDKLFANRAIILWNVDL